MNLYLWEKEYLLVWEVFKKFVEMHIIRIICVKLKNKYLYLRNFILVTFSYDFAKYT